MNWYNNDCTSRHDSFIFQIGSFDIQKLKASNCSYPNAINVSLEYAMNSSAPGALLVLVPMKEDDSLDFTNALYEILPRDTSDNYCNINASVGRCRVFGIDIENNNTAPLRRHTNAAATETVTNVSGENSKLQLKIPL